MMPWITTASPANLASETCLSNCRPGPDRCQLLCQFGLGSAQIIAALQVHPELLAISEEPGQAHGRICRDRPPFPHDIVDPRHRHLDFFGQLISRKIQWPQELLSQDLS